MRIIHASDICLGAPFVGLKLAGDRLRASLKSTFSKIVKYTAENNADLFVLAGNLFHNLDCSRSLQDSVAAELSQLKTTQVCILPGILDSYADGSFWKGWDTLNALSNVTVLDGTRVQHVTFKHLDCTVYGIPSDKKRSIQLQRTARQPGSLQIGVMCCEPDEIKVNLERSGLVLDHVCLGGSHSFENLGNLGLPATYSGAPEKLDFGQDNAGNIAVIELNPGAKSTIKKLQVGSLIWHSLEVEANKIANNDDLINTIKPLSGPDSLLRLHLTGLALFESSLRPWYVQQLMEQHFLYLEIQDEIKVLPENVSEVRVSEKTILGQFIKIMAQELSSRSQEEHSRLERSTKIGYTLLQGRELW